MTDNGYSAPEPTTGAQTTTNYYSQQQQQGIITPITTVATSTTTNSSNLINDNSTIPTTQSVAEWLESLGMGKYKETLEKEDVTWETLREMTENDLKDLGFTLGHRKKVISSLKSIFGAAPSSGTTPVSILPPSTTTKPLAQSTTTVTIPIPCPSTAAITEQPSDEKAIEQKSEEAAESNDPIAVMKEKEQAFIANKCVITNVVLDKVLGEGAFGQVLKGTWQGNSVACKKTKSYSSQEELLLEAETNMKVRHPNCVSFFGVFFADGFAHLVTEFMPLGSLYKLLQMNAFTQYELISFARDAAAGMMYLSSIKIVHRDLATRNLLVKQEANNKFTVKVADFGLSRNTEGPEDEYHSVAGVMPYRWSAPESMKDKTFTTKSDVWSYGVTVWEIFSRAAQPFTGLTNSEVKAAVLAGQRLSCPSSCPRRVWEITYPCWNSASSMRPTFEVIHATLAAIMSTMKPTTATKLVTEDGTKENTSKKIMCIQCGHPYTEEENADESCAFHIGWCNNGTYQCCNKTEDFPCTHSKHHPNHHVEYLYSSFITWANRQRESRTETWMEITACDYESRSSYSGEVGLASQDLYIKFDAGVTVCWITFNLKQIQEIKNDDNKDPLSDTKIIWTRTIKESNLAAYWKFCNGQITGVGLRISTPTSEQPIEKIIPLLIDSKLHTTGKIITLFEDEGAYTCFAKEGEYTLPPMVEKGTKIIEGPIIEPKKHDQEGNAHLIVKQLEKTMVWQDYYCRDGKFLNHFRNKFSLVNISKRQHSIMEIRSEYLSADGKTWIPIPNIIVFEDTKTANDIMPILLEPNKARNVYVSSRISITGNPGRDNLERERAHVSLPQPLLIKITFENEHKDQTSLIIEQVNRRMSEYLPNKEEKQKNLEYPITHWVQCDDTNFGSRIYFMVYVTSLLDIAIAGPSYSIHLSAADFHRAVLYSRKNRDPNYHLTNIEIDTENVKLQVSLAVDLDRFKVYAIHAFLQTSSSSIDVHLPFPDLQKLHDQVYINATPEIVVPGSNINVAWGTPFTGNYRVSMYKRYGLHGDSVCYKEEKQKTKSGVLKFEAPPEGEYVFVLVNNSDTYRHFGVSNVVVVSASPAETTLTPSLQSSTTTTTTTNTTGAPSTTSANDQYSTKL